MKVLILLHSEVSHILIIQAKQTNDFCVTLAGSKSAHTSPVHKKTSHLEFYICNIDFISEWLHYPYIRH